jgi:hypothetical protein
MLIACIVCACNDSLDITQKYAFDLRTMPYPKKIVRGETVELRLQIVKEGNYAGTKFFIRYFQTDGKGELKLDGGTVLTPNDLFPLTKETFRLYYTSQCTDQQNFDVYIEDNFGQVIQKTFSLSNETADNGNEERQLETIGLVGCRQRQAPVRYISVIGGMVQDGRCVYCCRIFMQREPGVCTRPYSLARNLPRRIDSQR